MEKTEEATLLKQLKQGDELEQRKAYTAIYNNYKPAVVHYLVVCGRSMHEAEDIAQDVFTQLWIKRSVLPALTSLLGYLNTSARNKNISDVKRQKKQEERDHKHKELLESKTADDQELQDRLDSVIRRVKGKWNEIDKKVFEAAHVHKEKHRDIAAKYDLTVVGVKNILSKCMRTLAIFKKSNHEPKQ